MKAVSGNSNTMLLRGGRVVLPDGVAGQADVLIEDERISRIFKNGRSDKIDTAGTANLMFDLHGHLLLPGFIDVHIHGAVGVDTMEATPGDLHLVARFLARHGVTGWLPTLVPAPEADYIRSVSAVDKAIDEQESQPAAARILGIHYEGPFINTSQCGALRTAYFRTFKRNEDLDSLPIPSNQNVKRMITVAPEIEGGIELARELNRRGWIFSIGHTSASLDVLDQASEAGARHMTHFMNAMTPFHHRAPGPIGWGLTRDDVTCDVIADGIHVDPFVLRLVLRCKSAERVVIISDAVAPAGLGDGEYQIWGETITVNAGRTSNHRGSIAGSVGTIADALRMLRSLGTTESEVARMTSGNAARLLQLDEHYGSIEEGKRADLVALDEAGNVRLTVVGGRIAFDAKQQSRSNEIH